MKWFFTLDGESDCIACSRRIIGPHDVRRFHPNKEDGSLFHMSNGQKPAIGAIHRGIGLLIN
jgi:hypothetical protein